MKTFTKIISATLFTLSIIGCNNNGTSVKDNNSKPLDIIRKNAEEFLKKSLNDPSSYEFVALKPFDTIRYKKNIVECKDGVKRDIDYFESNISYAKNQIEYYSKGYLKDAKEVDKYKKELEENQNKINNKNKFLNAVDSIETSMGNKVNDIAALIYIYSFRAKNSFGALVLNDYYLEITPGPDYKILNIAENNDKLLVEPNGFPGESELYSRYK
jgi:hypothetical protein